MVKGERLVFDFWRVLGVFDDQLESCVPAHHSLAGTMLKERQKKMDGGRGGGSAQLAATDPGVKRSEDDVRRQNTRSSPRPLLMRSSFPKVKAVLQRAADNSPAARTL